MGKSTATGYRTQPELEAEPDLIDAPIRPLVQALSQTGWAHTVFSCAGHPEEPDSIQKGRRQAHIDLLVSDLSRWQTYVRSIRHLPNLRVTEGPLGPVPEWLPKHKGWKYRRLVLEPKPYDMPPDLCLQTLETALAAATSALQSPKPHTSHADTH